VDIDERLVLKQVLSKYRDSKTPYLLRRKSIRITRGRLRAEGVNTIPKLSPYFLVLLCASSDCYTEGEG